jgi:hypothetical protein
MASLDPQVRARVQNGRLRPLFIGLVLALGWGTNVAAANIVVDPRDDLASMVKTAPPGSQFVLSPGRYLVGPIQPKDGQSFIGRPGAVLSGAVPLGPFAREGRFWRASGPRPLEPSGGECELGRDCLFGERLFVDGTPVRRVLTPGELGGDSWLQDRATGAVVIGFEPAGRDVEMSYRRAAFYGPARDVTIRGLVIEHYASTAQHGAIQASDPEEKVLSAGWQVLDNDVRFNSGGGIRLGNAMRVEGNRIFRNGQIGVVGEGTGIVIQSNDIAENNALRFSAGWEAGGTKFVLTSLLQVRNNCVRDNHGPGIWTDVENRNAVIVGNWSVRNRGVGIYQEIGGKAVIEANTVAFNGSPEETPWNSQILVSGSIDTLVQNNRVEVAPDYGHAIFIVEEGRKNALFVPIHHFPTYASRGNTVMNNHITFYGSTFGGVSGVHSSRGRVEDLVENNRFERNSITVAQGSTKRFRIGSDYLELEQAQRRGQELHSRLEVAPPGRSANLRLECPPGVGGLGAPR